MTTNKLEPTQASKREDEERRRRTRSPSRSVSPASGRNHASGAVSTPDVASGRNFRAAVPAPLVFHRSADVGSTAALPTNSPLVSSRSRASSFNGSLSALPLGHFAETTTSAMLKVEVAVQKHSVSRTLSKNVLSPDGKIISCEPRLREFCPAPVLNAVGWSHRTEGQRPDDSRKWLRSNSPIPFYTWGEAFEKSTKFVRSPACGWGQE
ncbi:unnamed protein product, partial [Polarella glacialis]